MTTSNFDEKLRHLKNVADRHQGCAFSQELGEAINAFEDVAADYPEFAAGVSGLLPKVASATGAGLLAIWLGASVEKGADPELTYRSIAETFARWSRTVKTAPEDDAAGPGAETMHGLQFLGQALVAHLARTRAGREWLAATEAVYSEFDRLEHVSPGALWVMHLLKLASGELVVLDPAHKMGVLVRYGNIANCFHLFTLLQGALADILPGAPRPDGRVLAVAKGLDDGNVADAAWWHYSDGLTNTPALGNTIWGEMSPAGIPVIDGVQVIVLWPPMLASRSWDSSFFKPFLEASKPGIEVVRVFEVEEAARWWRRLGLPDALR